MIMMKTTTTKDKKIKWINGDFSSFSSSGVLIDLFFLLVIGIRCFARVIFVGEHTGQISANQCRGQGKQQTQRNDVKQSRLSMFK